MANPNPASEKSEVWKKMAEGGLEDHPELISTFESLLEKTVDIQDDTAREKILKETFKKGVELLHRDKLAGFNPNDLVDDDKIEDLILACLEVGRELDDGTEEYDEEEEYVEEGEEEDVKCGPKGKDAGPVLQRPEDHTYNKPSPSMAATPPFMSRTLPRDIKTESLTIKSEVRLDGIKQVISHNKVKKIMKPGSGSNPFVQRLSTATSTGLPKYIFTPRGGVQSVQKVNINHPLSRDTTVNQTFMKRVDNIYSVDACGDKGDEKIPTKPDPSNAKPVPKNAPKPAAAKKPDPPNTIVIKHSQQWTVGNFSKKMRMGNGRSIDSMLFSVRVLGKKTEWSLMLYPNGDKESAAGFLSLYLTCRNRRALDMSLEFKFNLRDSEGETAASPSKSGSITAQMLAQNSSWGWESFVKQDDLKRNGLLVNNKVTIICDITLKIRDDPVVKIIKEEVVIKDGRDIDALVNFVGELSTDESKKKKKKNKNKSKKLINDLDDQNNIYESNPAPEEDVPEIVDIVDLGSVPMAPETKPASSEVPEETLSVETDCDEFQVVSRRRRRNSQSGALSPVSPPAQKQIKGKGKSKSKGGQAGQNEKSPKEKESETKNLIKTESKEYDKPSRPKPVKENESTNHVKIESKEKLNKEPVHSFQVTEKHPSLPMLQLKPNSSLPAFCIDTKESLEELLKTKNMLEENIRRLTDFAAAKSEAIGQMNQDKVTKMQVMSHSQEKLREQKISLENHIERQKKIIEELEADVLEVDNKLKRSTEKEARMMMYLDMNIADASSQLTQFGKEKDDLEGRLDQVENKLRGNRRKERLLTIHTQILRLQTNLECPICAETASTLIYQCREGHMVCSSCVYKIARCPMCRQDGPVNVRNRYAENDSQELAKLLAERDAIMSILTSGAIETASC